MADVRLWYKADITIALNNVRFWHKADIPTHAETMAAFGGKADIELRRLNVRF